MKDHTLRDKAALDMEDLRADIKEAITDWDKERLVNLVTWARESGLSPIEIVNNNLFPELLGACSAHGSFDLSFSELLLMADTIQGALDILMPEIRSLIPEETIKGTVVIGTVQGDIHEFGKNLVAAVFQSGSYRVVDLGRDVPLEKFIMSAEKEGADVMAVSALMTPALINMEALVKEVKTKGMSVKTIIGGLATSPEFAEKIGADAWAGDALTGLKELENLVKRVEGE